MCFTQRPQRSDVGKAQTCGLAVSSQELFHWATALPPNIEEYNKIP